MLGSMICLIRRQFPAVLIFWLASLTQAASPPASWYARAWKTDEGLPDNAVVGMAQTPDGFLWVATQGGLVRFDGQQFRAAASVTAAGVPSGLMRVMCVDRQSRLWVAKALGVLVCLDGGRTTAFTTQDGLPQNRAKMILADGEGGVWVAYSGGLVVRILKNQVHAFTQQDGLPGSDFCQLAIDRAGKLWFVADAKVGVFRDDRFVPLTGVPEARCIATARAGGIWICAGAKVFRFNEGGKLLPLAELPVRRPTVTPTIIYEDGNGGLWVGTSDEGLFRYNGAAFEMVNTSHPEISSIAEDREGNLWVGTMGGGLNRLRPAIVQLQDTGSAPPLTGLRSICQDAAGSLWAVDRNGGLARNEGQGWRSFSTNEGWTIQNAASLAADPQGGVWIGTQRNGLHLWRDRLVTSLAREDGLAGNIIRSLLMSPAGDLWIGTTGEDLQRYRAGQLQTFKLPPGSGSIGAMVLDAAGNLWVGTAGGLLLRVNGNELVNETRTSKELPQSIRCLCATEDGSLWIGYAGTGLGRLKGGRFTQFREAQGLHDDYISQILDDEHGRLWLAGNRGLFSVRAVEFDGLTEGRTASVRSAEFGHDEGLPALQASWEFWPGAMRTADRRLQFTMQSGLAVVQPDELNRWIAPPPVIIERVLVDSREVAASDFNSSPKGTTPPGILNLQHSFKGLLQIPAGQQELSFAFTAPSFATPKNVSFKYQLEGLDKDWVGAGGRRVVSYRHVPPGNYRFRVTASNNGGAWNDAGSVLAIEVLPYFWQMWWFQLAALLVFIFVVGGAVRYVETRKLRLRLERVERESAIQRERARIARDIHDDLGSSLTEITLLSELAQGSESPGEVQADIKKIAAKARHLTRALDETVWAVNPRNDTLDGLVTYTCNYAEDYLRLAGIRCRLEVPMKLPAQAITTEVRHNLFLVVKEALHNVVKHAAASEVWIRITTRADGLSLVIEDNGKGFDPRDSSSPLSSESMEHAGQRRPGNGLLNMRQRISEIGGRFNLCSEPGKGSKITLEVAFDR